LFQAAEAHVLFYDLLFFNTQTVENLIFLGVACSQSPAASVVKVYNQAKAVVPRTSTELELEPVVQQFHEK
jgi:hypothetical protein